MNAQQPKKKKNVTGTKKAGRQKAAHAFYVYCLGRREALTPLFEGGLADAPGAVECERELEFVASDDLAAVVSAVPLADYSENALQERLDDPQWTALRAVRHQEVVQYFAARVGIIPLRFGTIYLQPERIEEMIAQRGEGLRAILSRLDGREEWGVNIYRDSAKLMESMESLSPRLREANEQINRASPGQAYLLRKKMDALRATEARTETARVIAQVAGDLTAVSDDAAHLRLIKEETTEYGELVGKLAFLVVRANFDEFRATAERLAQEYSASGFKFELMGPWPAYNFAAT